MPRYAIVTVIETADPERAWDYVAERVAPGIRDGVGEQTAVAVYVGNPCPVPTETADNYTTSKIVLTDSPASALIVTDPNAPEEN